MAEPFVLYFVTFLPFFSREQTVRRYGETDCFNIMCILFYACPSMMS